MQGRRRERPCSKRTRPRGLERPCDDLRHRRQRPEDQSQTECHEDLEHQAEWEEIMADESSERGSGGQSLTYLEADEQGHLEDRESAGRMEQTTLRTFLSTSPPETTQDENASRPHTHCDGDGDGQVPVRVTGLVQSGLPRVRGHERHQVGKDVAHHRTGEGRSRPPQALDEPSGS